MVIINAIYILSILSNLPSLKSKVLFFLILCIGSMDLLKGRNKLIRKHIQLSLFLSFKGERITFSLSANVFPVLLKLKMVKKC